MSQKSLTSNTVNTRSYKEIYNLSKIYYKYLVSVNNKLNNSNNIKESNIINFNKNYNDALLMYTKIKKELFWLENGDNFKDFSNNKFDDHKSIFMNNFTMLECISKLYGFDLWYTKYKCNELFSNTSLSI